MKIYNSKLYVGIALLVVIALICVTFKLRVAWWGFIDIFFFFIAAFSQLTALTLGARIAPVGAKLSMIAFLSLLLAVLALIGEAIAWYMIYN